MLEKKTPNNGIKNPLLAVATFVIILLSFNPDWGSNSLLWWASVAMFIFAFFITKQNLNLNSTYVTWILAFFLFCGLSCLWAVSVSLVIEKLKSMVVHVVILILLSSILTSKEDIEFLLKIVLVVCLINAIYLVLVNREMMFANNSGDRLGTEGEWNANEIGMMMAVATIISIYFITKNILKAKKVLILCALLFLIFVAFITGSRKAFFMVVLGVSMFLVFSAKGNKKLRVIMIVAIALAGAYILVMNEPFLYSILGWRLEGLFASITGVGDVDASTEKRELFIEAGLQVFVNNPIIGCGLDCFKIHNQAITGEKVYSHNNYVELLANLGIVGTFIYYSLYFEIFKRLLKNFRTTDNLKKLFFVLMILVVIVDYGSVNYSSLLYEILLCGAFAVSKLRNITSER